MPRYTIGGQAVRRKNAYMACIVGDRFDSMTREEQGAALKAAYWADNITASEWPVVLQHDDCTAYAKSRLKRKAAGWLVALAHLADLHEELFAEIAAKADDMHREQFEKPSHLLQTLRKLAADMVKGRALAEEHDDPDTTLYIVARSWIEERPK